MWCQLSHKILLGSHGGVNFVKKYIVIVLVVYLEGILNITEPELIRLMDVLLTTHYREKLPENLERFGGIGRGYQCWMAL